MNAALRRGWHRARRSLRARLVGLFLLLALAMTLTFVAGMQAVTRYGWQVVALPLANDYIDRLAAEIGTPPDPARAAALARRLPLRIRIEAPAADGQAAPLRPDASHHGGDRHGGWRAERLLADGHRLVFGLAHPQRDDLPEDRAHLIGWGTLLVMLLLVALVYARMRRLLAPLAEIRAGAIRYGAGDFSRPIGCRGDDELGELAGQVDGMADGLRRLLDAKRGLLLAISHELRSPLTRARLNAELVEAGRARDALLVDLAEMRDLIADLLESERLAGGHAALATEPVQLDALVEETVRTQFAGQPIVLRLDPTLPTAMLDPARLRLLLRNLLANALRHGANDIAPPEVRTALDAGMLCLTVRDHGPGVDPDRLGQLAQAFYRPDAARQRTTGGVGLGLYLCRLVAEAHGGTLVLRPARPGLAAEVRLPLAGAARATPG